MTIHKGPRGADTTWLAVDDADEVAQLYTGVAGALPRAWAGGQALFGIDAMLIASGVQIQVDGLAPDALDDYHEVIDEDHIDQLDPGEMQDVVLLECAHPRVQDLIRSAARVSSSRGHFMVADMVDDDLLVDLLRGGEVLRVWTDMWTIPAPALGLFTYEHAQEWETRASGPYERRGAPSTPIKRVDLSPRLSELVVHLPGLRFADADVLQPAAHVSCAAFDEQWVDVGGRYHETGR